MRALSLLLLFAPSLAAAATGTLEVRADGAPGEVILDGFPTGKTAPARLESVPTGDHEVEVEHGCLRGEAEVFIDQGAPTVLELEMVDVGGQGTLFLRGVSESAQVTVDGEPVEGAAEGVRVACGSHEVSVLTPGFEAWSATTVVTTGKRDELKVELVGESFDFEPEPRFEEEPDEDLDVDPIDEAPREPDRPLTALELLDEDEDEDAGRRGRDRDEEPDARADELFGDLDDPEFDERGGADDDPDFDERGGSDDDPDFDDRGGLDDEPDFDRRGLDDPDLDDRRIGDDDDDGEGELERIGGREPVKPAREPLPARGIAVVGSSVVGVGGLVLGVVATPQYTEAKAEYDLIALSRGVADPVAIIYKQETLAPAQGRMAAGYLLAVAGGAGAAASYFLIPPRDAADLVILPLPGGVGLSGSF